MFYVIDGLLSRWILAWVWMFLGWCLLLVWVPRRVLVWDYYVDLVCLLCYILTGSYLGVLCFVSLLFVCIVADLYFAVFDCVALCWVFVWDRLFSLSCWLLIVCGCWLVVCLGIGICVALLLFVLLVVWSGCCLRLVGILYICLLIRFLLYFCVLFN